MTEQVYGIKLADLLNAKGVKNNQKLQKQLHLLNEDNNIWLQGDELKLAKELLGKKLGNSAFNEAIALIQEVSIGDVVEKTVVKEQSTEEEVAVTQSTEEKTETTEVEKTESPTAVTASGNKKAHEYTKGQMEKLVQETIPNKLREYAGEGRTPKQLIEEIKNQYGNNPQLQPIISEIENAYAYMKYSNKNDVQKVFKGYEFKTETFELKEAIKQSGKQAAKNDLILKDVAVLSAKYNELKENNPSFNKQELLDKLEQDLDNDSNAKLSYKKESFNKFKKEFEKTMKDMRLMGDEEIKVLAGTTGTDRKSVKQQYKAETGYKTDVKTATVMKHKNLAEQRKTELSDISYNNLKKLEGYNYGLWNKLKGNFLQKEGVYNPEKNTYNLTDLYTVFDKYVGADATINFSQDKENAENHKILADLQELIGNDITMTDVKNLARLCGYGIDARDRSASNYSASDAPDALAGIITGILTSVDIKMTQVQGEFVKDFTESELKELMGLGYKLTEIQGKQILVDPQNVQVMHVNTLVNNLLIGGATTLALSLLGHFVIGEPRAFEVACISLNDQLNQDFSSVDELKQYVEENYGAQKANAIEVLAKQFVKEDGSFDNKGFKDALTDFAGAFSNMNCYEVAGARVDIARTPEKVEDKNDDASDNQDNNEEPVITNTCIAEAEEVYENTLCCTEHILKKGDSWSTLIHTYYQDVLDSGIQYKDILKALRDALGAKATDTDLPWLSRKNAQGKTEHYLEMPCELLGVQCNNVGNLDENREKYNVKEFRTENIKRSDGRKVEVKPTFVGYNAISSCNPQTVGWGQTKEEAYNDLKRQTPGVVYENENEFIKPKENK